MLRSTSGGSHAFCMGSLRILCTVLIWGGSVLFFGHFQGLNAQDPSPLSPDHNRAVTLTYLETRVFTEYSSNFPLQVYYTVRQYLNEGEE